MEIMKSPNNDITKVRKNLGMPDFSYLKINERSSLRKVTKV